MLFTVSQLITDVLMTPDVLPAADGRLASDWLSQSHEASHWSLVA